MHKSKKWSGFVAALLLILAPINQAEAQIQCTNTGGCGYQECRRAPCITAAVALSTIALIAIIAVAVQNSGVGGSHAHQCGNNNCCNSCGCN